MLFRSIDQDAPHLLAGYGEEVSPVPDFQRCRTDQPDVGLVDQGRGLQGVSWTLTAHLAGGNAMQFGIDEFNGRLAGIAISVPHPVQQSRKRWLNFPRVFWVARHFRSVYSGGNRERNRNLEERPRSCHRFEYFFSRFSAIS